MCSDGPTFPSYLSRYALVLVIVTEILFFILFFSYLQAMVIIASFIELGKEETRVV